MRNFQSLDTLNKDFIRVEAKREFIKDVIGKDEFFISSYKSKIECHELVNQILLSMADHRRKEACKQLEDVCSYALQYATGRNLQMRIDMKIQRNKVAADIIVVKPDSGVENFPLDGGGGGLADIIATALRFTMLSIYNSPKIDGPVIFDEPYKNVSADYIPQVADFLLRASQDFGRQIILSTHNDFIASMTDTRYRFALNEDDETVVTKEVGGTDEDTASSRGD